MDAVAAWKVLAHIATAANDTRGAPALPRGPLFSAPMRFAHDYRRASSQVRTVGQGLSWQSETGVPGPVLAYELIGAQPVVTKALHFAAGVCDIIRTESRNWIVRHFVE